MKKNKQAVILAGGKGRRLEPYTTVIPKPLMPVGEQPILEIVIKQLRHYGFKRVKIAVGHLAGIIQAYFGDGSRFGMEIEYSFEDLPLGTVGPLSLVNRLDEDFLIMNGDLITDLNFCDLYNSHIKNKNLVTIGIYKKNLKIDLGIIGLDRGGKVVSYSEKPTVRYPISMGVYAFNKKILQFIPKNEKYDFPDLINFLIKENKRIGAYLFDGYWKDIGNHEDYRKVAEEFPRMRNKLFRNILAF